MDSEVSPSFERCKLCLNRHLRGSGLNMEEITKLLRQQLSLLKQIRLLLVILTGSVVLPVIISVTIAVLTGYNIWSLF